MSQGEKKMWDYLRPKLKAHGHFDRIESHATAVGVPDIDYCISGYCNNLELKWTDSEKRGFRLRPAQAGWFRKRVKALGQPWLLALSQIRGKRGYVLIPGASVPDLVHTTRVTDWLGRGVGIWEDKIDIDQLVQFLGTYLVTDAPLQSPSTNPDESSGLILPSHLKKE